MVWLVDITDCWDRKLEAILAYQSQFVVGREQLDPTFAERLRNEAAYWGQAIGVKYGEPYACREPIGLSSWEHLI